MDLTIINRFHDGNQSHAGDVILTRPIILSIKNSFEDIRITLQFPAKHHYLLSDLGLPVVEKANNSNIFNAWFGYFHDILHAHHMTYFTQLHSFNRQMEQQKLFYRLQPPDKHPMIEFPHVEITTMPQKCILVENGPSLSFQNYIDMNEIIPKMANDFKDLQFYTSSTPPTGFPNVHDCQSANLISLSNLSNVCTALMMRGSGVNAASYTEINRNKPRAFLGWNYPFKLWDNNFVNCKNYGDVYIFLEKIRRST
jgi:hypothetical protein